MSFFLPFSLSSLTNSTSLNYLLFLLSSLSMTASARLFSLLTYPFFLLPLFHLPFLVTSTRFPLLGFSPSPSALPSWPPRPCVRWPRRGSEGEREGGRAGSTLTCHPQLEGRVPLRDLQTGRYDPDSARQDSIQFISLFILLFLPLSLPPFLPHSPLSLLSLSPSSLFPGWVMGWQGVS